MMIKDELRRHARKLFRSMGYQRRIAPSFVDVMHSQGVDIVLDVGANDGDFGREIRDSGYRGTIVSFEPNPVVFKRLVAAAAKDPDWHAFRLGVGDVAGHLDLSITALDAFSSFKKPSRYGETWTGTASIRTERVAVIRLDDFLAEHPEFQRRIYLKIDTQGFEMEVLRGTGLALRGVTAVQAELGVRLIYADQEDWLAATLWMRERGFELATLSCNSADRAQGQIIELDMVFVQRRAEGESLKPQ